MMEDDVCILTLNSGSSSLKFALVRGDLKFASGKVERIGLAPDLPDHNAALTRLFAWVTQKQTRIAAVGHRLVYGGRDYTSPRLIDPHLLSDLRKLTPFAPEHLPHELDAIEAVDRVFKDLPQVACFDTAFHSKSPEIAHRYPLPDEYPDRGVIRYGFHGLSYEYILGELGDAGRGKVIIAHLGNGASMAAVRDGAPLDTTMGFTPAGGLMMGTRTGDLDPGVMLFFMEQAGLTPPEIRALVNERSGLLGVSGRSSDMQELLARESSDPAAALAIELFCYQVQKFIGSLAAVLGGLDTLVFTAGIGENSAPVRARICAGLEFLGIRLDPAQNDHHDTVISDGSLPVLVKVMRTDEEVMIARHTRQVIGSSSLAGRSHV